jgi:hypothetical protein
MAETKPIHSAAQSAAGYLFQARLALAECLRFAYGDSGIEIAIEKLDDVSFEKDGIPCSRENPKVFRVYDAEIIRDRIAPGSPVFWYVLSQEM